MAQDKTYIEIGSDIPQNGTSARKNPSGVAAMNIQINAGANVTSVIEGVLADIQGAEQPQESDWVEVARFVGPGIFPLKNVPSLFRVKALGGPIERARAMGYRDPKAVPETLPASLADITFAIDPIVEPVRATANAAQALAEQADTKADSASNALGNLTLAELSTRPISAGPQLANGSRWLGQASGTPDGGTVVAAAGGGVWVREYDGTLTPEMFGAKGDGVTDDKGALWAMCAAYRAGAGNRMVLSRPYRVGRGTTAAHVVAALEFVGVARVHIEFTGRGEIIMDNLNAAGGGDQYGGIYVAGPCDDVQIIRPRVRWASRPGPVVGGYTARGQGDGIMLRGYPGDTGDYEGIGPIRRATVDHPFVQWAPQTGLIFLGVGDPHVIAPTVIETGADACHFNACRRPRMTGGARFVRVGDDGLPFVTYYGADRTPIYAGTGAALYRTPWFMAALSEWSNGGGYADKVEYSGNANGTRINGGQNITIDVVETNGAGFAVQYDAVKADGVNYLWTVAASRGCRVNRVIARNTVMPVLFTLLGVVKTDAGAAEYYDNEVSVGDVIATGTTGPHAVRVAGLEGVTLGNLTVDKPVLIEQGAGRVAVQSVTGPALTLNAVATVDVQRATLSGAATLVDAVDVTGVMWRMTGAAGQALYMERVSGVSLGAVEVVNHARGGSAVAALFARAQRVRIDRLDVTGDGMAANLMELGGGSEAGVTDDVRIGDVTWKHAQATNTPGVLLQGGPYAPVNYAYSIRHSNGAGWLKVAADTYA